MKNNRLILALTALLLPGVCLAMASPATPPLVGFKPKITAIEITPDSGSWLINPTGLNVLTANTTFAPERDGDALGGHSYFWEIDGKILTGYTHQYPLYNPTCASTQIRVQVTPKTLHGSPTEGDAQWSDMVQMQPLPLPPPHDSRVSPPVRGLFDRYEAAAYCASIGKGLPNITDLQDLAAAVGPNLAKEHGYPLDGACGGASNIYWSVTSERGVDMVTNTVSSISNSYKASVICN